MEGQEINYQTEYENLKIDYEDLLTKHNNIEKEYGDYRVNNELEKDIRNNCLDLTEEDKEMLKQLKITNQDEAYKVVMEGFKTTKQIKKPQFTKALNNSEVSKGGEVTFASIINDLKGDK